MSIITVRLPSESHTELKSMAHDKETSLNKLCIEILEVALAKWKLEGKEC